jgi:putative hemolysin
MASQSLPEKFPVTKTANLVDKPWEEGAIKVIRKAQVPVVPIYFHARNSWLFYFLSKSVGPSVLQLPSEVLVRNVAS